MESLEIAVKNYNATVNFVMRAVKRVTLRVRSSVIHVPRDFPTISAAVTAASAGDTILVQRGVYRESVTIPSSKSHIRIIANGTPVILDGGNNLGTGFTMMADHVEIQGFTIRDFKRAGIRGRVFSAHGSFAIDFSVI
ncbi:hypothetical protein [Alicyclobacillus fastidiosus]|uniref:hypothetical protein n=1 Tax=Alicyclobacillus fastidiosus TaxID=392011 RepID=UPI0023E966A1|nr:hypothetical protein [Alicyclobacillus fastidiosus]GMA62064.1 hypothetical protein GCM10025859_25040 [Alicyclobacillus fastidiosus]